MAAGVYSTVMGIQNGNPGLSCCLSRRAQDAKMKHSGSDAVPAERGDYEHLLLHQE